ncbi:hypothetical protein QCA50_019496 [Cerrena zonata]|uniref:CxC2-like cysteine cluster KDZ transposase-associated domain-containing protein n=1 Tax=Cerrena zonata TaxID=2478898 RepID=A0AAW0F8Z9_9APHY
MTSKKNRPTKKARYEPPDMIPVQQGIATHIVSADGTTTHTRYLSPRKEKTYNEESVNASDSGGILPSLVNYASQMLGISSSSDASVTEPSNEQSKLDSSNSSAETMDSRESESQKKAKTNNTIKPHVTTFGFIRGWAQTMLNVMLSRETDPHIGKPCYECRSPEAPYHCYDCFSAPLLCRDCIIGCHRWSPLHRILCWNDHYFERRGLKDLGYTLYLGHHGKQCHNQITTGVKSTDPKTSTVTVVDTTGIHLVDVMYCKCPTEASAFGEDHPVQLWKAGLWPATYTRPQTVFSLHV